MNLESDVSLGLMREASCPFYLPKVPSDYLKKTKNKASFNTVSHQMSICEVCKHFRFFFYLGCMQHGGALLPKKFRFKPAA